MGPVAPPSAHVLPTFTQRNIVHNYLLAAMATTTYAPLPPLQAAACDVTLTLPSTQSQKAHVCNRRERQKSLSLLHV